MPTLATSRFITLPRTLRGTLLSAFALTAAFFLAPGAASEPADPEDAQPQPKDGPTPAAVEANKSFVSDLSNKMMEDLLRMREFIDTTVPGTLKKYNLVFGFSPRTSDLRKNEYMRLPVNVRYGLSNRWEISGGVTPFIPSPINSGEQHRWGMGMASLGLRYNWGHWGKVFDQVTLGLDSRTPLGKPPVSIIDYYAHLVPSIATSRPLPFPHTFLYTNISYDRAYDAPWREQDRVPEGILKTHTLTVTAPSILYKPGEFGAFFEHNWRRYSVETKGIHYGYEFKVGPIWDVPLWRTQSWGLPGKWQVELAGRVTFEEGQDISQGVSLRVRWRTSLREVFSKKSYQRVPRP